MVFQEEQNYFFVLKASEKIIPNEAFFAVLLGVVFPYLVIIIELIFRHTACGWVTSLKDPLPEICITGKPNCLACVGKARTTHEVEKLRAKNQQIINKHLNSIEK